MPLSKRQSKVDDFFASSSSPVKIQNEDIRKRKSSDELLAIQINDSDDNSDVGRIKLAPSSQTVIHISDDSEDEDSLVEQTPHSRRLRQRAATQVVQDVEGSDSDEHTPLNRLPSKRKYAVSEDSDEGQPKRRRILKRGLRPTEDEEDMLHELDQDVVLESRLRKPPKPSEYSKNLKRLRQKRLALKPDDESDESSAEESDEVKPIPGSRRMGATSDSSEAENDDEEEDFIVDDSNEEGETVNLPAEYSIRKWQPLSGSFKIFFQLLVHVACQPAHLRAAYMKERLSRQDDTTEYLKQAVGHVRRQLSSIRDSQVASSLWTTEFRTALGKYPKLEITIMEAEPYCDACRRHKALSTRRAVLSGKPYDRSSFEEVEDASPSDSDDSESDGDSVESRSSSKQRTLPESDEDGTPPLSFTLGQHCARRVSLYHAFMHWELRLFRIIEEKVIEMETSNRRKREKKKVKKLIDTDDPDNIVARLDQRGFITNEWSEIKSLIDRAKTVEQRYAHEID